nr:MAG TPA: hypothetical protein [Caudoviricetes sp.]
MLKFAILILSYGGLGVTLPRLFLFLSCLIC